MAINTTLLRAFIGSAFLVAYVVGLLFTMRETDLKHFSIGFWIGAAACIILAPMILAYVAAAV